MFSNVPYLIGNKYLRDHQYWPTVTRAEYLALNGYPPNSPIGNRNIDLAYPIGVNLDTIQALMWKVKEWSIDPTSMALQFMAEDAPVVSADDLAIINQATSFPGFKFERLRLIPPNGSTTENIPNEGAILADWRNQPLVDDYWPPARTIPRWKTLRNQGHFGFNVEADCTWDGFFSAPIGLSGPPITDYNHTKFSPASESGTGGRLRFSMSSGYVIYNSTTQLFYPRIEVTAVAPIPSLTILQRISKTMQSLPVVQTVDPVSVGEFPEIHTGTVTFVIGATSFDIPVGYRDLNANPYVLHDPEQTVERTITGSLDITVTATKFWPYSNTLGQPVYDATTGAQINNPFA